MSSFILSSTLSPTSWAHTCYYVIDLVRSRISWSALPLVSSVIPWSRSHFIWSCPLLHWTHRTWLQNAGEWSPSRQVLRQESREVDRSRVLSDFCKWVRLTRRPCSSSAKLNVEDVFFSVTYQHKSLIFAFSIVTWLYFWRLIFVLQEIICSVWNCCFLRVTGIRLKTKTQFFLKILQLKNSYWRRE